ncbi:hypothetical protein WJX73_007003 [Symbiochloris irregularis]|uniref:Uncharacterized protein n=1 Tax=Symbiochloris irregularis TaxID=706552 RepID=A0AAW1PAW5_9CHLO
MGRLVAAALLLTTLLLAHAAEKPGTPINIQNLECGSRWRVELLNAEGDWQGDVNFELLGADRLLYVLDLQDTTKDVSLAEISLQATQPDKSILSMTLSLPLCNEQLCVQPYYFMRTAPGMMEALSSAVALGLARLTVHLADADSSRLGGEILLDCGSLPREASHMASLDSSEPQKAKITCPLPQSPVAYEIPLGCTQVQDKLKERCGLTPQAVALASGFLYDSEAQLGAGFGAGLSMCLPEGCKPCDMALDAVQVISMDTQGNFEVAAEKAPVVGDLLTEAELLEALPEDKPATDKAPCHPACTQPGFGVLYDIPRTCDHFSDRAAVACGVSMVDLASAAAGLRSGGFTGFGPGASVCLPDSCDPCAPSAEFDDALEVGVESAALHERTAEEQEGAEIEFDVSQDSEGAYGDMAELQQASAEDLLADEHDGAQGRIGALLHMVGVQ